MIEDAECNDVNYFERNFEMIEKGKSWKAWTKFNKCELLIFFMAFNWQALKDINLFYQAKLLNRA